MRISRTVVRSACALTVAAVLFGAGGASRAQAEPSNARQPQAQRSAAGERGTQPNIVVILLDDVPAMDAQIWRYTPNIRRLFIEEGVRLAGMHVESPLCCPGRAGWLTGQHTFNHHVDRNDVRLLDPSMTIATQLDGVGYETFYAGKYFNGYPAIAPSVPPGWDHFHGMGGGYYGYTIWNDGSPDGEEHGTKPRDYSTDVIGAKALNHLRHVPRNEPFLGWVSFYTYHAPEAPAPRHADHAPCESIPPRDFAGYNEKDVSDKPTYVREKGLLTQPVKDLVNECRMMQSVDDWVGAFRDEIRRQGRLRDTIFVLTADNGMNAGAHRLTGKSTPYSTQVPFYIRWEDGLGTTPRSVGERLSNIDLAPTLCDFAGCQLGPYPNGQRRPDGRSFAPLLLGEVSTLGRDALLEDMPAGRGTIPPWYALATTRHSPYAGVGCASADSDGCRWHYVEYDTGERELYDVSNGPCATWQRGEPGDPCELRNRAYDAAYAGLVVGLSERLAELKAERGGPRSD